MYAPPSVKSSQPLADPVGIRSRPLIVFAYAYPLFRPLRFLSVVPAGYKRLDEAAAARVLALTDARAAHALVLRMLRIEEEEQEATLHTAAVLAGIGLEAALHYAARPSGSRREADAEVNRILSVLMIQPEELLASLPASAVPLATDAVKPPMVPLCLAALLACARRPDEETMGQIATTVRSVVLDALGDGGVGTVVGKKARKAAKKKHAQEEGAAAPVLVYSLPVGIGALGHWTAEPQLPLHLRTVLAYHACEERPLGKYMVLVLRPLGDPASASAPVTLGVYFADDGAAFVVRSPPGPDAVLLADHLRAATRFVSVSDAFDIVAAAVDLTDGTLDAATRTQRYALVTGGDDDDGRPDLAAPLPLYRLFVVHTVLGPTEFEVPRPAVRTIKDAELTRPTVEEVSQDEEEEEVQEPVLPALAEKEGEEDSQ